jgi:hypothetical protein
VEPQVGTTGQRAAVPFFLQSQQKAVALALSDRLPTTTADRVVQVALVQTVALLALVLRARAAMALLALRPTDHLVVVVVPAR